MMRTETIISASVGLLFLASLVGVLRYKQQDSDGNKFSKVVATEEGVFLRTLFDREHSGVIRVGSHWASATASQLRSRCSYRAGLVGSIERLFSVSSVEAVTCVLGTCGGSWMWPEMTLPCGEACHGDDIHFGSNPLSADPWDGWRYSASPGCDANDGSGPCTCLEVHCTN